MRILSLHPATTELVFALGAGHQLVGRTDACNYPEAALKVPSIGSDAEAMQQAVAIFEPDVILLGIGQESFRHALGPARKAVIYAPASVSELFSSIGNIAEMLGKQVEADLLIHDLQAVFERVQLKCAKYRVTRVLWEQENRMVPDPLIAELMVMAGGEPYSSGPLVEFNPYYIIAVSDNDEFSDKLAARKEWKELQAVQNERVLRIDASILRATPRIAQGARQLAKLLHGVEVNGS